MERSTLKAGVPFTRSPPGTSAESKTVRAYPRLAASSAQAKPPGPEPTAATRRPLGGAVLASACPCAKAYSARNCSMAPIETGSDTPLRMHDPSHRRSVGHTRAQISAMFVAEPNTAPASRKRPSAVNSIHCGMGLQRGQPVTQLGFGHWMQRLARSEEHTSELQ